MRQITCFTSTKVQIVRFLAWSTKETSMDWVRQITCFLLVQKYKYWRRLGHFLACYYKSTSTDADFFFEGIYTWPDGRRYEGEFQFDVKDGIALMCWANSDVCWRMLAYVDVCWRMLAYPDVSWRILTYTDVWVTWWDTFGSCCQTQLKVIILNLLQNSTTHKAKFFKISNSIFELNI